MFLRIIDNIVINKAFIPELPGEWAGGLIQINTRDVPAKNFFSVQAGTGFNTQTIGHDFYKVPGGKTDWLGVDDGYRNLPSLYTTKTQFDGLSAAEKTAVGREMKNDWTGMQGNAPLNVSFQTNGGINTMVLGKKVGGMLSLLYNKSNRYQKLVNRSNAINGQNVSIDYDYNDDRYAQDISWGATGGLTVQIDPLNKISIRSLLNVNTQLHYTAFRYKQLRNDDVQHEIKFRQNTFFGTDYRRA